MKDEKFGILILLFLTMILSCNIKTESKKSAFKIVNDYSEFIAKMENSDTLNIGVNLSICAWSESDKLQITKTNDSLFLQLTEKRVMFDEPRNYSKISYKLKNDTLSLERMMKNFDINYKEEISSPFFTITNPKEKDTILLRTTGLGNRGFNIKRYQNLMKELYPKEMEKYRNEYLIEYNETEKTETK